MHRGLSAVPASDVIISANSKRYSSLRQRPLAETYSPQQQPPQTQKPPPQTQQQQPPQTQPPTQPPPQQQQTQPAQQQQQPPPQQQHRYQVSLSAELSRHSTKAARDLKICIPNRSCIRYLLSFSHTFLFGTFRSRTNCKYHVHISEVGWNQAPNIRFASVNGTTQFLNTSLFKCYLSMLRAMEGLRRVIMSLSPKRNVPKYVKMYPNVYIKA
ncbi:jg1430 [Pararge aegeria aegeria]|uniref:Jg1430 protein n=1 Tax=Pararge aegeria aegeria TaxID=348720 RepID=A0A8S4QJK6_9NEOP|nr:jg1430 [Pararge aegeria aegeria]